jgi:thioesterase III
MGAGWIVTNTKNMKKILNSRVKIRFQDCDPFNHLNNARYTDYFINAREEQILEHYGLDLMEHVRRQGKGWLVVSNQTQYRKPAHTQETVEIQSHLIDFNDKTLHVEMTMWDAEQKQLKALTWIKFLYVDLGQQRVSAHDAEFMQFLESVVEPVEERIFEERCKRVA